MSMPDETSKMTETAENASKALTAEGPVEASKGAATYPLLNVHLWQIPAEIKLRQLTDDVSRARGRLRDFRMMLAPDVFDEIDGAIQDVERKINDAIEAMAPECAAK